jgi:23S rRNA pseudouridine1911/1915/1917 synthase
MPDKINIVFDADSNQRLDKYLVEQGIQELYSRTLIEKLIWEDNITVNSIPVKKSYQLSRGDIITICMPIQPPLGILPQDIPLDIVFEDDYLAVINKPAGLIVHPGHGNPDNTLVNAIVFKYGNNLPSSKGSNRPGIVHRLDSGTSGLIIITKDDKTQSILSEMFAKRQVKKTYLALTTGIPEPNEGRIETNISRSKSNPRKMFVTQEGRLALTSYKVVRYYQCFALIEVGLETGRMHQIRLHMEYINNPILGDMLYNSVKKVQDLVPDNMRKKVAELLVNHLKRQALHAWKMSFTHPFTKVSHTFTAPLPEDFIYTLDWMEKYFAVDNLGYEKLMLKD